MEPTSLLTTFFNRQVLVESLPMLLQGLGVTVRLGAVSILAGLAGGLSLSLIRLYAAPALRACARVYIDVFRSLPLLVLLVLVYYALPFVGLRLSSFAAAATALSLVSCAYTAEIFRAGIEAVPRGQFEAAAALGLRFRDSLRHVILPQALRIVMPPLTSNCINVMKDTALASVVAMPDLLKQATQAQALAANPTPLIGAAVLYLALLLPLVRLVGYVEARQRSMAR
jgi:polar amino acid transport system permease protein